MVKFFKKAISAFLASVMCIPAGIINVAVAEENDTGTVTTVTLDSCENGFMQFSESCMEASTAEQDGYHMIQVGEDGQMNQIENDGSIWAFNQGNIVEIELIPNENYGVGSFCIKDATNGNILAYKETTDNIFSFTMPSQSLTVEAVFKPDVVADRAELTDPDAIALQEIIDALPEEEGFYSEYEQMGEETLAELWQETNDAGGLYFNTFSDEQREQVDASKLYSTLLLLDGYQENDSTAVPDNDTVQDLQDRINTLPDVCDIAETSDINENGYANYCYSDENTTMKITEKEQDNVFLETLELSETLSDIDSTYTSETFDVKPLSEMVMFFTAGVSVPVARAAGMIGITEENPLKKVDKDGLYPTKGVYTVDDWLEEHYSSEFSLHANMTNTDTGKDKKYNTVAYCANPSRARYHEGSNKSTKFTTSNLKELKGALDSDPALTIKLILWYGKKGPGYGNDGAPEVDYVSTHFALGKAYANDTGNESKTHASQTEWKKLYNFCKKKADEIREDRIGNWPKLGKLKGDKSIDFANFRVFSVIPPKSTEKYQHIFFYTLENDDTSIDPLYVSLFKIESDSTKGSKNPSSTLKDAEFVVEFYLDNNFTTTKTAELFSPTAKWTFSTKNYETYLENHPDLPVYNFDSFDDNGSYAQADHEGSKVPMGAINFSPNDPEEKNRNKWKNDFIADKDLASWQQYWGQKGTYIIYEKNASQGFKLKGEMLAMGNPTKTTTKNVKEGIALFYNPDNNVYKVNGEKITAPIKGHDESVEGVALEVSNVQQVPTIKTNASVAHMRGQPDTQYAKVNGGPLGVQDTVVLDNNKVKDAKYVITTYLFDKTANKYVDITWLNNFAVGPDSNIKITVNNDTPASETDGPSISYELTSDDVSESGEYEFTVDGNITATSGLADHTLVFINKFKITADGKTTTTESSKDDTAEYIYLKGEPEPDTPEASTNIMGNQIKRKAGTGESIIYAGKYKDETYQEGGGEILQSLTDTIDYSGLEAGKSYTIKAWLVNADTGENAVDAAGNEIKCETTKTASGTSGSWDIKFEFDATGLGGKTYVAFAEIYDGSDKKFDLKDKDNKLETFLIPGIETKLTDTSTGTNFTTGGNSLLVDKITYTNLLPNTKYKVVSRLVDASTGETGTDANGNEMKSETEFTADSSSGSYDVDLEFNIDASTAKVYVAFEEIFIEKGSPGSGDWVLVADHKDIMDQNQRTVVPSIKTFAKDQKTDGHLSYAEENYMVIYDTLHYENFVPGLKYRVDSELIDTATNRVVVDDDGIEQSLTMYFTADENLDAGKYLTYGDITPDNHDGNGIVFKLNGKSFAGHTFVIYERVYVEDETGTHLVASHTDPLDENQTIHIPKIWTNAIDVETQTNISYADETAIIKDTISYENLIPGLTYEIRGRVIDRKKTLESGEEVIVAGTDGKLAENKVIFTPDTANGEKEITFDIDLKKYVDDLNKSYDGAVFVVYEDLYVIQRYDGADDRSIVASHTDINDENQTIYLPKITTSLNDSKTGTKLSYAEANAHLIDTINYFNLKPSTQYTVKGRLYNMEDGKVLEGSEKVQQFTSNATGTGSWALDYTFDASKMQGMIVVAYAEVYIGDKVVATHDEFWDVEERVYFPKITTDAMDLKTGDNISLAEKTMKIIDTVHYKSLSPGYTYKLVSELRDQATGEIVVDDAGNEQVLTTHFKTDFELLDKQYLTFGDIVPKAPDSDEATFTLDSEYFAGRTLVIFERLYIENESGEHLIADHQDLLDERQTISVGNIWSDAIDMDTFTKTLHSGTGRATVIDTVGYTNLMPGHTYELRGYVVEKDRTVHAGTNVLATAPGGGEARNSTQFVPSSSSGSVRLSFDIDVSKYATDEYKGAVLVVYQELYHIKDDKGNSDMRLVASHTDIGNLRQTVYIPYIWTDLNDYKTGTKVLLAEADAHIVDTISYTRFQPNSTYTVKGKIIDMEKGTTLTDSSGKKVEKEMEVTASDSGTGTWALDYEFDASKLQGKILVAYADVYVKNGERPDILSRVATHSNFWDVGQRVYIPKISTVATDQKTNSHVTFAEDNAWVTDRIYYSHLQPDTEYKLISKLVDKDTGEVVVDDKKVKQEIESTFTTTPNESQEKYNQTIKNPFADSNDTGIGYSYGYIIPADGTTLPDGSKYKGVVFNFDAHTFEGRTLVIFEELQMRTKDGYQTIATHMDINDENQTVHIPKIRTNAVDSETLTHSSKMDGSMTVIDTITYENLIPGFTYEVEGFLMDKPRDDTKGYSVIKDAKGNPITNKKEFVADKPNGTVKLSLSGDARSFQTDEGEFSSETLVVFERLYLKNNKDASDDRLVVAVHEDINDENQTIYCPRISTKVVSYDFGEESKDGDADHVTGFVAYECDYCKTRFTSEHDVQAHIKNTPACLNFKNSYSTVTEATIYDRVYYENLIPNRTYEIVGHIIDTKTGKAVTINNRMVQSEKKYFTPGTSNGEVDVVFHVTGLDLAGGRYVCYEELFYNGTSIAEHKDKFDDNQTFYVPDIVTSAMDYDTKSNISKADTISTIIDTVEMTGLKENEKYRLSSVLMDATTDAKSGAKGSNYGSYFIDGTGEIVHAKEWRKKGSTVWHSMDEYFTIDATLSPEDYRGTATIEVKFEVDTVTEHGSKDYQGMTYVVFQELYTENGTLVAQHKDITDKQQTIYVGGMYTVALDGSPINGTMTNLMDGTSGDRTLVDYIYYSNLLPNKSYYVTTNVYIKEMSKGGNPDTDVMQPFEAENAVGLMAHQYTTKSIGSGYWAVNISLSGEKLKDYLDKSENGITLVVYEEIHEGTMDGKRVALENNLYNESQSVHIPKIKSTVEEDKVSGLHYTLSEGKWICDNDECVIYACDGCGKEFHSEEEAEDHLYDCREGDSYTCTSGVFESKAEAEAHVAPVYECNNCKLHFSDEADAENHVNGKCKDGAVVRATQLVRDEDNNVVNELWYACSACGAQFKTNKECLGHINGSDTCYNYTNINASHHSYSNINAGVTDTVSYSNLIPGKKYRIQGKIYNTETKEPALTEKEEEITSSKTFIPMASQGSVKLDFEFDGTYLAGHKYAVYTEILLVDARYDTTTASTINNPVVITKHNENLSDKEEAFYIPKVSTSAKDYYTQTNVTKADSTTTIVDDVTFEGLNTTDKYCIKGIIMDQKTMKPLVLADGSQAEASTGTFQVDKSTDGGRGYGTKQLRFTFSTTDLEGKTLVVFERLYLVRGNKETLIGQHTEIMDEKQTTHIPKMRTYAYDMETGEQTAGADNSVTLVDRVVMENLVKGKRYKLEAKLVDPTTGKVLQDVNGHDITGTLDMYENRYNEFTASTSGRTERTVKFVFDGSNMTGKSVVVHIFCSLSYLYSFKLLKISYS